MPSVFHVETAGSRSYAPTHEKHVHQHLCVQCYPFQQVSTAYKLLKILANSKITDFKIKVKQKPPEQNLVSISFRQMKATLNKGSS